MPALRANLKLEVASTREFPGKRAGPVNPTEQPALSALALCSFPAPQLPLAVDCGLVDPAVWLLSGERWLLLEDLEREKYMPAGVVGFMSQPG